MRFAYRTHELYGYRDGARNVRGRRAIRLVESATLTTELRSLVPWLRQVRCALPFYLLMGMRHCSLPNVNFLNTKDAKTLRVIKVYVKGH